MNFLETIEALGADMNKSATDIDAALRKTHPAHVAFGTLHRLERCLFDSSEQIRQILSQVSTERRETLANIE
jgi:3-dehydroquinate synthase class II